ncbi:hypothetical protein B7494_g2060 [Chlorociboria aeruginascens]|nr:hypothetical protein B7494_g2060 [Chlorociboria aeruginascens]
MPSNLQRKAARRKKQTRLTFDVVNTGSSSVQTSSPAKVRDELPEKNAMASSSPKYTEDDGDDDILSISNFDIKVEPQSTRSTRSRIDGKLNFKALPTPAKSSQLPSIVNGSDFEADDLEDLSMSKIQSSPIPHTSKKHSRGISTFDGLYSSSDGSSPEEVQTSSKKKKKNKGKAVTPKKSSKEARSGSGSGDGAALKSSSRRNNFITRRSNNTIPIRNSAPASSSGNEFDGYEDIVPENPSTSKSTPAKPTSARSFLRGGTNYNAPLPKNFTSTRTSKVAGASKLFSSTRHRPEKSVTLSDSDGSPALPTHPRSGPGNSKERAISLDEDSDSLPPIASSQRRRGKPVIVDDEDSDEISLTSKSRRTKKSKESSVSKDEDSDTIVIDSPFNALDDDSEDPISSPLKRRRPMVEEEDSSDLEVSPSKRTRRAVPEDDSGGSDLPSPSQISSKRGTRNKGKGKSVRTPVRHTRQRIVRKHRTKKEKMMELLKRKRAGENIDQVTTSEDSDEGGGAALYDNKDEALSNFEDESEIDEVKEKPRRKQASRNGEDHYDSDFVIDDDDELIGVPHHALSEIPLKFTHRANKPLKEHFKDAVEWMVHNKINPAFPRNDPIYKQAFLKLDFKYNAYASSKFVSTQWTSGFTRAIYARPNVLIDSIDSAEAFSIRGVMKCDVCNHQKHIPTFAIKFQGKAYHKDTLEEIDQGSDDSDNSDSDAQSIDSKGHDIPPEDEVWFAGSVCKKNADQAHTLIHWKYALNVWVVDTLESDGYLKPEKLAEREKMKAKQRKEYANRVVDQWEADRVIKKLYTDFKNTLETAMEDKMRWR